MGDDSKKDLSAFSEVELDILRASPRWNVAKEYHPGCSTLYIGNSFIYSDSAILSAIKDKFKIGDIIVFPETEVDIVDESSDIITLLCDQHEPLRYHMLVDDSWMLEEIHVGNTNVIKIPVRVCEKVGLKPHWGTKNDEYKKNMHPIEYYGNRVRYKFMLKDWARENAQIAHRYKRTRTCTYELELTFQQYKVAESLPEEQDGWRSWPSLSTYPDKDGVHHRELSTEVKFKLLPRENVELVDELFEDTLPYEVRKIITSHIPGTAILLLED